VVGYLGHHHFIFGHRWDTFIKNCPFLWDVSICLALS
jgi:hypothetical protein